MSPDESSTSTSDTEEKSEDQIERIASVAGSPTAAELAKKPAGHKMAKRRYQGKDLYVCSGCGYSTFRPDSAAQHEKRPR